LVLLASQFGSDAYEFAKDKNIFLMDGNNLLHLFEKHGYSFRIDLGKRQRGELALAIRHAVSQIACRTLCARPNAQ
jgi:hypothetical protein